MAVPKRKMSRSNTRSRRANYKASAPTLTKAQSSLGGEVITLSHRAYIVKDSEGNPLHYEYKGKKVASV